MSRSKHKRGEPPKVEDFGPVPKGGWKADPSQPPRSRKMRINKRRERIEAMLLAGFQQREIAQAMGMSETVISHDVAFIHREWRKSSVNKLEVMLLREGRKLDKYEQELVGRLTRDRDKMTPEQHCRVVDTILKVIERRAKLFGLDKPEVHKVHVKGEHQHAVFVIGGTKEEFIQGVNDSLGKYREQQRLQSGQLALPGLSPSAIKATDAERPTPTNGESDVIDKV